MNGLMFNLYIYIYTCFYGKLVGKHRKIPWMLGECDGFRDYNLSQTTIIPFEIHVRVFRSM